MNGLYYANLLCQAPEAVVAKRRGGKLTRGKLFILDNTTPATGIAEIDHLLHSPDLVSSQFLLFFNWKKELWGRWFSDDSEIEADIENNFEENFKEYLRNFSVIKSFIHNVKSVFHLRPTILLAAPRTRKVRCRKYTITTNGRLADQLSESTHQLLPLQAPYGPLREKQLISGNDTIWAGTKRNVNCREEKWNRLPRNFVIVRDGMETENCRGQNVRICR